MVARNPSEGCHAVTPYVLVRDIEQVVAFLKDTFDATELFDTKDENGVANHAEVSIGDSVVMLGRLGDNTPHARSTLFVYDDDVDGTFRRAIELGGESVYEPSDQSYGGRCGTVRCPGGHNWSIVWPIEDAD